MRDVLDLQSEIAQAIAREVQIKMTPAEQARFTSRHPVQTKGFRRLSAGPLSLLEQTHRREPQQGHRAFSECDQRGSELCARPMWVWLTVTTRWARFRSARCRRREARRRAEEAATKALELDARLAEAYSALGYVKHFNWDWTAAEQDFKRAIELNPNYANAHNFYASYLMSRGRVDESIAASNRARELDPFSLSISAQRGFLLENARRYDEAIEQLRSVIAMDPNHYQAYWILGHTYAANRQFDEAIAAAEKAVDLSERTPGALGILGLAYGLAGRKAEATEDLE